jgi:hypothetical protein
MHSTEGKSLVGFMEQPAAVKYLRQVCAFDGDQSDARLSHEWQQAKRRLGAEPVAGAGRPSIEDIPSAYSTYVEELALEPWLAPKLVGGLAGAAFKMVEIEPLLAMQFAVDVERSRDLCAALSTTGNDMQQLFALCLPRVPPTPEILHIKGASSMLVTTRNLSLKVVQEGRHEIGTETGYKLLVGIELSLPVPLLHVVRFEGRCYLHNGFHRAYGARLAGFKHAPCIFRDVDYPEDIGIGNDTFQLGQLRSANPPTVAHFTQGRAYDVRLRSLTRVLQVSWSEYTI